MSGILTRLNKSGRLYIGKDLVTVSKITISQWKQLFTVIETLPALIVDVMLAPKEERVAYFVLALERSFDEIVLITSILTGIAADDIEKNASLDQLLEYFVQVAKVNDFNSILKNVKSVLALTAKKSTENAE